MSPIWNSEELLLPVTVGNTVIVGPAISVGIRQLPMSCLRFACSIICSKAGSRHPCLCKTNTYRHMLHACVLLEGTIKVNDEIVCRHKAHQGLGWESSQRPSLPLEFQKTWFGCQVKCRNSKVTLLVMSIRNREHYTCLIFPQAIVWATKAITPADLQWL